MLRDRVESVRSSLVVTDSRAAKDRIHRRTQKASSFAYWPAFTFLQRG